MIRLSRLRLRGLRLTTLEAETCVRDAVLGQVFPGMAASRADAVPVLANLAQQCAEDRFTAVATDVELAARSTLAQSCNHVLRRCQKPRSISSSSSSSAARNNSDDSADVADDDSVQITIAKPQHVTGWSSCEEAESCFWTSSSSSSCGLLQQQLGEQSAPPPPPHAVESTRYIWNTLFCRDNSAMQSAELRQRIIEEVLLPVIHRRRHHHHHHGAVLSISLAELQLATGWHRFYHVWSDLVSIQDELLDDTRHEVVLVAPGRVVSANAAVWAEFLSHNNKKQLMRQSNVGGDEQQQQQQEQQQCDLSDILGVDVTLRAMQPSLANLLFGPGDGDHDDDDDDCCEVEEEVSAFRHELRSLGFDITVDASDDDDDGEEKLVVVTYVAERGNDHSLHGEN